MEDAVEAAEVERVVREVDTAHVEVARVLLLQRRVVVVAEAVEADDLVPVAHEALGEVRADEPGRSGDDVAQAQTSSETASSSSGSTVPPSSCRTTSEKNRVMTTPSRNSPNRGSGRSPFASASASSGYREPAAVGSGNAPPKRGLTSVTRLSSPSRK